MKDKTRKILRRIGAASLLGLSFLNFGSSWGRQRAKSTSRRVQHIRKQTREELDSDIQEVAQIAEKEAEDVIKTEMQQREQQQVKQQQTQIQIFLKYTAIGGWGVAMGIFFMSMIFNKPFGLGKAVLSLLPGEPHVAILTMVADKDIWQVDNNVEVGIQLATNQEKVNYLKTTIVYDPTIVALQKVNIIRNKFDIVEENKIDQKNGVVTIVVRKTEETTNSQKDIIAMLTFKALRRSDKAKIEFDQSKSLVIKTKTKNNKGYNILGKVKGLHFKIVENAHQAIICSKIDVVKSRMNRQQWEWLVNSAPIPLKSGNNWVDINNKLSLLCAYSNDGSIYMLAYGSEKIKGLELLNTITGKKIKVIKTGEWLVGKNNFYTAVIDSSKMTKELPNKFRNMVIYFKLEKGEERWPKKNSGEIVLQERIDNR